MQFEIHDDKPIAKIMNELGWWEHGCGIDDISELVAVCMIMCDKIDELETKIKKLESK